MFTTFKKFSPHIKNDNTVNEEHIKNSRCNENNTHDDVSETKAKKQ